MASYLTLMSTLSDTVNTLGYNYLISDNFEINGQSDNFNIDEIYIIRDAAQRTSNNIIRGNITNTYPIILYFTTNILKDYNQDDIEAVHDQLKTIVDKFMYNLNSNFSTTMNNISSYSDIGVKITDNNFYAIQVKFNIQTQCNL